LWLQPSDRIAFAAGAATGGLIGARLPDIFDPPCTPNHRQVAHAVAPVGFLAVKTWAGAVEFVESTLAEGDLEINPVTRFTRFFVAGLVKGAALGYLSHLALDACTPCGLPLLGI